MSFCNEAMRLNRWMRWPWVACWKGSTNVNGVIRVNVQLVDGRSGATKWAQRYDLRSSNILSFEDQIATKVVDAKCESQPPNRKRFSNPQPQVRRRTTIICKHVFTGTSISYIPTREVSIKAKSFWSAR